MTTARLPHAAAPASRDYCLSLVRAYDNENYLANLLHPHKPARAAHAALRAFNVELANVRANVSNEDLGRLRLAFFRDGLSSILAAPSSAPPAPVLDALAEAIEAHPHAPFRRLHRLVDAREADLAYPSVPDLSQLEAFAADTHGSLAAVHAAVLAGPAAPSLPDPLFQKAGVAVGLAVLLRAAPAHAASRLSYVPRDLAETFHVAQRDLLTGAGTAPDVFECIAARAETLAQEAKELLAQVPEKAVRPAFWPLYMADIYLARLRRAKFNPFEESLQIAMRTTYPLVLQLRLLRARLLGS